MGEQWHMPRLVVAGAASGVGKTSLMVGLLGALARRGQRVAAFKCGPDYLDPTYHQRVTGRACHNLDGWMMGRDGVLTTFARGCDGADIAVIEGVMGLFDGASPKSDTGSTAEIAKWLQAPVLLAVDASGMSRTIGAIAHGFTHFDPEVRVSGLIANRVGSRNHLSLLREAPRGCPVLGGLPKRPDCAFAERHLGLHTARAEAVDDGALSAWADLVAEWCDLDRILAVAESAPAVTVSARATQEPTQPRCRIGLAQDEAFHFYYPENLRLLESHGAELVPFSPLHDSSLPEIDGLYLGGGYPETHAEALASNRAMREDIREFAIAGRPLYAECGGLMYLSDAIRTLDDASHPMVGVITGECRMCDRLKALGYVEVETQATTLLGGPGLRFRGHQFRYSELEVPPHVQRRYRVRKRRSGEVTEEGYAVRNVLASYVHAHWASNPTIPATFVASCAAAREGAP